VKFKYIDALRGIAILLVMIVHTSQYGEKSQNEFFNSFFKFGAKGVQLFFLASAFTLFLSYNNRNREENKNVLRSFYIRRFFRIAPMYYIGIIFFSLFNQNGFEEITTNNLWNVLSN
jgi:peptidoglycan/LPS O-acetylase OafA/YrhL